MTKWEYDIVYDSMGHNRLIFKRQIEEFIDTDMDY